LFLVSVSTGGLLVFFNLLERHFSPFGRDERHFSPFGFARATLLAVWVAKSRISEPVNPRSARLQLARELNLNALPPKQQFDSRSGLLVHSLLARCDAHVRCLYTVCCRRGARRAVSGLRLLLDKSRKASSQRLLPSLRGTAANSFL
jgi:hypothetical protein